MTGNGTRKPLDQHGYYGAATAGLTFYASCVRDLVFDRQQLFWQNRTQGYGRNTDPAAADLRYEGEVVPFVFRLPGP